MGCSYRKPHVLPKFPAERAVEIRRQPRGAPPFRRPEVFENNRRPEKVSHSVGRGPPKGPFLYRQAVRPRVWNQRRTLLTPRRELQLNQLPDELGAVRVPELTQMTLLIVE